MGQFEFIREVGPHFLAIILATGFLHAVDWMTHVVVQWFNRDD